MFWLGLFVGYILGIIMCFIVECLCIAAGKSDKEKWMEDDDELN